MNSIPTYCAQIPEAGLRAALRQDRPEIIGKISASGLKGRGGAGFPTAVKWNFAAAAQAERKFIICNADEGEPGTFKDRVILMEHPDLVFEGMTIAGKAVGAREGILFLRGEYTYLRSALEETLAKRRRCNLLGKTILGSPLEFDIPREATAGGSLSLKWFGTPGLGGNGRGNQVAEVWLIRQNNNPGPTR